MKTKKCAVSGVEFTITEDDLKFYEKMGVPEPTLCPAERLRRRSAFRNQRFLYRRKCSFSGDLMISQYPEEVRFPVIKRDLWYGDEHDPLQYGQEIDWDRPLMDQLHELQSKVPRLCVIQEGDVENSQYTQAAANNKNCYLVFSSNTNEDCLYGTGVNESADIVDGYQVFGSELCYQCTDVFGGYEMLWSQNCYDCKTSALIQDCRSCSNCLYCVNLVGKEYYIWNKKVSKEEFEAEWKKFLSLTNQERKDLITKFRSFLPKFPKRYFMGKQTEDCVGDYLMESKSAYNCFECQQVEDCRYCNNIYKAKDCMDITYFGKNIELCYETQAPGLEVFNARFCNLVYSGSADLIYCDQCFALKDSALCVGMKKSQYCILNKQYAESEYKELLPKIIEKLKQENQWGEFFPTKLSTYGYNETIAQEYFPLTKQEALSRGYTWKDEELGAKYDGVQYEVPENIKDVKDDIVDAILTCEVTEKQYRIVKPELEFYRKMGVSIPRVCPDERYRQRTALRNPRVLHDRTCAECEKCIQTTFAPERPEKVLCEECYLNAVD